jgi:predicted O-methyltransferase YrrM
MLKHAKTTVKKVFPWLSPWIYKRFRAPSRYRHLEATVKALRAKRILEVGVWNGERALDMISMAHRFHDQVEYVGFDLFEDLDEETYKYELSKKPPTEAYIRELLTASGATVTLYRGNTLHTLPKATKELPPVDFIFIDGGHHPETIQNDWNYCKQLMHKGTVVIFDDYWRNREDGGCKRIIDSIDREAYDVQVLPEVNTFDNPDFGRLEISFARVVKR